MALSKFPKIKMNIFVGIFIVLPQSTGEPCITQYVLEQRLQLLVGIEPPGITNPAWTTLQHRVQKAT
jgi:hypothetical protein